VDLSLLVAACDEATAAESLPAAACNPAGTAAAPLAVRLAAAPLAVRLAAVCLRPLRVFRALLPLKRVCNFVAALL